MRPNAGDKPERLSYFEAQKAMVPQSFALRAYGSILAGFMPVIILVLKIVLSAVTPVLRQALEEFLVTKYQEALVSENPYDEFLYEFFLRILSIPIPTTP